MGVALARKSGCRLTNVEGMQQEFMEVGVTFEPFTPEQAETAARLYTQTRNHGLSLADRACLALALDKGWPVMTADRAWAGLDLAIEVEVIR